MEEKRKILSMLAAGQIEVEEALSLLEAVGHTDSPVMVKGTAKMLRINVDSEGEAKVRVNVPISLAKFALRFVPAGLRRQIETRGIVLNDLLDTLKGELPEGRLVDIEATDEGKPVHVVIEVV